MCLRLATKRIACQTMKPRTSHIKPAMHYRWRNIHKYLHKTNMSIVIMGSNFILFGVVYIYTVLYTK